MLDKSSNSGSEMSILEGNCYRDFRLVVMISEIVQNFLRLETGGIAKTTTFAYL